jgi:putative heme-binding domain-containing protein
MPRIGAHEVDARATRLIADWIAQLPGAARRSPKLPVPPAEPEAIRRMTGTTRDALGLIRIIDQGEVPEPTLWAIVAELRNNPRGEIRDLFERFVPDSERVVRLGDGIDPATILALTGDAGRGREWFFGESAAQCKTCHRVRGAGIELGPDLDAIGAKYPRHELLGHILEPSRTIDPRYAVQAIATTDGRVHQGLLVEKGPDVLVLRDGQNRTTRIPTSEIERQTPLTASLMPEGLLRDLTAQQAADLLEFLSSLK